MPITYPPISNFRKSQKMVQYLEKRRTFSIFFCVTKAKKNRQIFFNFGTLFFVPRTQPINKKFQL